MAGEIANPVGVIQQLEAVDNYVDNMAAKWIEEENPDKISWWQFWKRVGLEQYQKATSFILGAIDDLIAYVDDKIDNGADKKATVLNAIGRLYDYVMVEALPIWLKPFAASVRTYIIDTLCSSAIDWIVGKYRNGDWRNRFDQPEVQALFAKPKQVSALGYKDYVPGGGIRPRT